MPRQNRVLATSDIVATPARGLLMGNRGILHDEKGHLTHRRWRHKNWVACVTSFRGRRRALMQPGHYTELFFLDEAVALAAGHRPCAECRRDAYRAYAAAIGHDGPAAALDARLHRERVVPRKFAQRRHEGEIDALPDFAAILWGGRPFLIHGRWLREIRPDGYGPGIERPSGATTVLTPPTSQSALACGYRPILHPSL